MKKHMFRLVVLVVVLFSFATVNAHFMWINITKSVGSSQIISFFGFGHALPMEDFLATEVGTIEIATFELIGPDASRTTLKAPDPEMHDNTVGYLGTFESRLSYSIRLTPPEYAAVIIFKADFEACRYTACRKHTLDRYSSVFVLISGHEQGMCVSRNTDTRHPDHDAK